MPGNKWRTALLWSAFSVIAAFVFSLPSALYGWAPYDDEGYILASLRSYSSIGHLFSRTYSQYGPFPYVFWDAFALPFGFRFDNLGFGRFAAAGVLAVSCGAAWLAVYRMTDARWWATFAAVAVWRDLQVNFTEPWHPGALIGMLLILLVLTTTFAGDRRRSLLQGLLLSFLLLTKINVGVFAVVAPALVIWLSWASTAARFRQRAMTLLAVGGAAVLPFAVVARDLSFRTAALAAAVALTGALAAWFGRVAAGEGSHAGWLTVGLATGLAGLLAAAFATGSTPRGLIEGIVTRPLRQRSVFQVRLGLPDRITLLAAVSVVVVLALARTRRSDAGRALLPIARIMGGLVLMVTPVGANRIGLLPVTLLLLLPRTKNGGEVLPVRRADVMLVLLAAFQVLHVYPVAGSQMGWALLLVPILGALLAARGLQELPARDRAADSVISVHLPKLALFAGTLFLLVQNAPTPVNAWRAYQAASPLDDLHARYVRVRAEDSYWMRSVATTLRQECSSFISIPGQASFYVFSGLKPPTGWIATAWPWLFDASDQHKAVNDLRAAENLCVLRNERWLTFWQQDKAAASGPLVKELARYTQVISRDADFEIAKLP